MSSVNGYQCRRAQGAGNHVVSFEDLTRSPGWREQQRGRESDRPGAGDHNMRRAAHLLPGARRR